MSEPEYRWSTEGALAAVVCGFPLQAIHDINRLSAADRVENGVGELVFLKVRVYGDWFTVVCQRDRLSSRRLVTTVHRFRERSGNE